MEGHAQNALSDTVNWQTSGATLQSFASLVRWWSSKQTLRTGASLRFVWSSLANCLKMLVLDTNWTTWHLVVREQACKISNKMDSDMWQTTSKADFLYECRHYCHVGNTVQRCRLGLFQDSDFAGDLEDSKSTSRGVLWIFGYPSQPDVQETNFGFAQFYRIWSSFSGCWTAYGWVTFSWSLRHWVFHSKTKTQHVTRKLKVDHVPTKTHSSQGESQLYIFEDNEAVIKMMIKGRSPTMRHVSRTHRDALAWLFDRINLEPKIQIKYVDTNNQNLLTFWPKEVSREMSGITLCVCLTSWVSRHFLAAISKVFSQARERLVIGAMSGQDTTSSNGSPVAKARPTHQSGHARSVQRGRLAS